MKFSLKQVSAFGGNDNEDDDCHDDVVNALIMVEVLAIQVVQPRCTSLFSKEQSKGNVA